MDIERVSGNRTEIWDPPAGQPGKPGVPSAMHWHAHMHTCILHMAYSIQSAHMRPISYGSRFFYAPESLETWEIQVNPERTDVQRRHFTGAGREMYRCRAGTVKGYAAGTARTDVMPVYGRQQGQKQVQMNVQK